MNNEELSLESLYTNGLGWSIKNEVSEEELFDGEMDHVSMELASAENLVEFTDMYSKMETKNAADKINMIKKLSIRYGRGGSKAANSIENFLHTQSIEAEADVVESGNTTGKKDIIDTSKINNKAVKFLATAFNAIANFIRKIFEKIISGIKWLINKIKELFNKEDSNLAQIDTLEPSEEDIINKALETTDLEFDYKDDTYFIPLNGNPIGGLTKFIDSIYKPMMERIVQLSEAVNDQMRVSTQIRDQFNNILDLLSTSYFPGVNAVPKLVTVDKAGMEKYKKDLNIMYSTLDFKHYTSEYCKKWTGVAPIQPSKNTKIIELCGTSKIKEIKKIEKDATERLKDLGKIIDGVQKRFNAGSKQFQTNYNKFIDKEGKNKVSAGTDEQHNNDENELVYSCFTTMEVTFKIAGKVLQIVDKVYSYINRTIGVLTSTINKPTLWDKIKNKAKTLKTEHDEKKVQNALNKKEKQEYDAKEKAYKEQQKAEEKAENDRYKETLAKGTAENKANAAAAKQQAKADRQANSYAAKQQKNEENNAKKAERKRHRLADKEWDAGMNAMKKWYNGSGEGPEPNVRQDIKDAFYARADAKERVRRTSESLEYNPEISIEEFYCI